jgi:putative ABC transport system permease protein
MLKNYFKISWRNLVRGKVYSFINITGLAIGLAVCMLIVVYVGHEYSYDKFHVNASRIFYLKSKIKMGNDSLYMSQLSYSTAPSLAKSEPSIEAFLRLRQDRQTIIQSSRISSAKFSEDHFYFADPNFFDFFSFKLLSGNKEKVLENPYSVVISEQAAQKYFAKQNPVGKILRFNNEYDLIVTGVAAKAPSNSTLQFDFVASLSTVVSMAAKDSVNIEEQTFLTYFRTKEPKDIARVEEGLLSMEKLKNPVASKLIGRFIGTPLTRIRQAEGADTTNIKYLKIFPFVAALVLLLALINYMSLSTARSTTRTKEIGVRKVLGAGREMIAGQFFIESILYTSIAFAIGYILCTVTQPFFFNFLQIDIDSSFLWNKYILLSFAGLLIISSLLAATYPSILLSAYKPVAVLYGKMNKQNNGISVRKFFTVFQFSVAVVLIVCGIVISKQISFFRNADTGVNRENIVMIPFAPEAAKHYSALKEDIGSISGVGQISTALHPMYKGYDIMGTIPVNSKKIVLVPTLSVDQHFIQMLGLKWKIKPADSLFYHKQNAAILNETAVEKLGLDANPINKKMDNELVVEGILKDFNYASLQNKIDALCVFVTQDTDTTSLWAKNGGCLFVGINPQVNIPGFLSKAKAAYEKYDSETPFTYHFLDDAFDSMYKAESRLLKILAAFTSFIIFIASLGLFGLAAFMVVRRTKEVGIRKVLGASVGQVSLMLSKDFIKLVIVAIIIASPVAWWIMNKWLEGFAYKINIGWWIFLIAGAIAIAIALITVSFQAIKAAIANPVKSLRTE